MSRVTYQEAETYISEFPKFTKKNTLEHTQKFLSFLGNPQNGKKVIHVAGTNGKGSVCVYLDAMLRAQRKHTGLFTSPHLIRMNERIRMDGEPVSDETFTRLFLRTQQSVRRMEAEGLPHPSFFEFLFGMAMAGFEEAGVEYVILETGLGGRLDATNSISGPLTCILTSIGLDHTEISKVVRIAGRVLLVAGAALDALGLCDVIDGDLHDAHQKIGKKTYSTAASIGGSWAGGALGAKGGALAGAAIGTAILPGLGTAVGGIAGGLLLGVAGSSLRKWVIDITDVGE